MMLHRSLLWASITLLAVACTAAPAASPLPSPPPSPSPSPSPSPGATLSQAQLKYALIDAYGPISWCDPDQYPIPVPDEQEMADQRFAEIQADADTFAVILDRLDLAAGDGLTSADKLAIYREWKLLNAVALQPAGTGPNSFQLITETDPGLGEGVQTTGTIDSQGRIQITAQSDVPLTSCPICLSRGTLIDTPRGPVAVDQLRVGDPVWTLDGNGNRVAGVVLAKGSARVPATHRVVHLVLADGRELWASPGHPLSDGRLLGTLGPTDVVDGSIVVSAELVVYSDGHTFDLLPSGATGAYWANGILIGSTLSR